MRARDQFPSGPAAPGSRAPRNRIATRVRAFAQRSASRAPLTAVRSSGSEPPFRNGGNSRETARFPCRGRFILRLATATSREVTGAFHDRPVAQPGRACADSRPRETSRRKRPGFARPAASQRPRKTRARPRATHGHERKHPRHRGPVVGRRAPRAHQGPRDSRARRHRRARRPSRRARRAQDPSRRGPGQPLHVLPRRPRVFRGRGLEPRGHRRRGAAVPRDPGLARRWIAEHHHGQDPPARPDPGEPPRGADRGEASQQEGSRGDRGTPRPEAGRAVDDPEAACPCFRACRSTLPLAEDGPAPPPPVGTAASAGPSPRDRAPHSGALSGAVHGLEGDARQAAAGTGPALPRDPGRRPGGHLRSRARSSRCTTSRRRSWPRRRSRGRRAEARMARATFPRTSGARSGSGTGGNAPFPGRAGDARSGGTSSGTTSSRSATRVRRRSTTSPCAAAPTTCTRASSCSAASTRRSSARRTEIYAVSREFAPFRNGGTPNDTCAARTTRDARASTTAGPRPPSRASR